MQHLREWQECDRIWRALGRPVPCDDPDYLAARERLRVAMRHQGAESEKAVEGIISDAEVDRVHGNADFGGTPKRNVISEALLATVCGYDTGSTARAIALEHELVQEDRRKKLHITRKGRSYLWAAYGRGIA